MAFELLEEVIRQILHLFILLMEGYGTIVIVYSASSAFIHFVRARKGNRDIRLDLAKHLAYGLEFFLAAEILSTVLAGTWTELQMLAAIIVIRTVLTCFIYWEIKQEQSQAEKK